MKPKPSITTGHSDSKQIIRLSERDCRLILAGFNWIAANYQTAKSGHFTTSLKKVWQARFDPGTFRQEFMDSLLALRTNLSSLGAGGRLRANTSYEIAACSLAVRIAIKRHRHGHTLLDIPRIEAAAKRLLRRLEVVRKRAKRAEIGQAGPEEYKRQSQDWRAFVQWVRVHVPSCSCVWRRRPAPAFRRRGIVDTLVAWTREELKDRKAEIPDDKELRRLVKLPLRYVRRGRTSFGIPDLLGITARLWLGMSSCATCGNANGACRRQGYSGVSQKDWIVWSKWIQELAVKRATGAIGTPISAPAPIMGQLEPVIWL